MIQLIIAFVFLPLQPFSIAGGPDEITGLWITPGDEAIVQIEKINGSYSAKILRIHPAGYINGSAPKDENNENSSLRSRSLEGITILAGITYDKKKENWRVKQVYDPDRGKMFEGFIVMQDHDRLKLRGHVPGKKWLGQTEIWKRLDGETPY